MTDSEMNDQPEHSPLAVIAIAAIILAFTMGVPTIGILIF